MESKETEPIEHRAPALAHLLPLGLLYRESSKAKDRRTFMRAAFVEIGPILNHYRSIAPMRHEFAKVNAHRTPPSWALADDSSSIYLPLLATLPLHWRYCLQSLLRTTSLP